ncbi:hypothetical protein Tco_0135472, partial [Tanacetum coccineum]
MDKIETINIKLEHSVANLLSEIRNTPSESVQKKKTPAKVDRGKGMDLLSDVALHKAAQLKKSKLETHKLHASGSDKGVGSLPKVPDEQEDKTTDSENESWGDIEDDDSNHDDNDDVSKHDDDDADSDGDSDNDASDSERT